MIAHANRMKGRAYQKLFVNMPMMKKARAAPRNPAAMKENNIGCFIFMGTTFCRETYLRVQQAKQELRLLKLHEAISRIADI